MIKTLRVIGVATAALVLSLTSFAQDSDSNSDTGKAPACPEIGLAITHPGLPPVPGGPMQSVVIAGALVFVGGTPGSCDPLTPCSLTFTSTVTVTVTPAGAPVADELCITVGGGIIPVICFPVPGVLTPTGVPGLYSAAFPPTSLSANCGDSFEYTLRIWVAFGGLGGPLILPVFTTVVGCGDWF